MRSIVPTDVPPYFWTISATSARDGAKDDRRVRSTEAERVRQRGAYRHRPRDARHEIEIALRIDIDEIRRWRRNLVANRQCREDRLDARRGTQQVPGHRFRRRDGQPVRMLAERALDRDAFGDVAECIAVKRA